MSTSSGCCCCCCRLLSYWVDYCCEPSVVSWRPFAPVGVELRIRAVGLTIQCWRSASVDGGGRFHPAREAMRLGLVRFQSIRCTDDQLGVHPQHSWTPTGVCACNESVRTTARVGQTMNLECTHHTAGHRLVLRMQRVSAHDGTRRSAALRMNNLAFVNSQRQGSERHSPSRAIQANHLLNDDIRAGNTDQQTSQHAMNSSRLHSTSQASSKVAKVWALAPVRAGPQHTPQQAAASHSPALCLHRCRLGRTRRSPCHPTQVPSRLVCFVPPPYTKQSLTQHGGPNEFDGQQCTGGAVRSDDPKSAT